VSILGYGLAAALYPQLAEACSSSGGPHYYAVFDKESAIVNTGLYSDVYIPKSGVADYLGGGFIGGTIWEAVANATNISQYWIETGWSHGWDGSPEYTFYWARDTPGNGYMQHAVNNFSVNVDSWMPMEIAYNGNDKWSAYLNGTRETSGDGAIAQIDADPSSEGYAGGIESTDTSSWSGTGYWSDLEYLKNGSWSSSLEDGEALYCDAPSSASWVTIDKEFQGNF
jgi:hypothetical protein